MNRYTTIIGVLILFCSLVLAVKNVISAEATNNQQTEERPDAGFESQLPTGWINSISEDYIIIDDTHYILTDQTRYPDGRSKLKQGEFVRFAIKVDKILARIYLTEPQEDDMYMKPIDRSRRNKSEPRGINGDNDAGQSGMRLENGVWVN